MLRYILSMECKVLGPGAANMSAPSLLSIATFHSSVSPRLLSAEVTAGCKCAIFPGKMTAGGDGVDRGAPTLTDDAEV